jgi:hypothetical protein
MFDTLMYPMPVHARIHTFVHIREENRNMIFSLVRRMYYLQEELDFREDVVEALLELDSELQYIADILIAYPIIRHKDKNMIPHYTRVWLEYKLDLLRKNLPSIHSCHTTKHAYINECAVKGT